MGGCRAEEGGDVRGEYPFIDVDCEKVDCVGEVSTDEVILEHGSDSRDVCCCVTKRYIPSRSRFHISFCIANSSFYIR